MACLLHHSRRQTWESRRKASISTVRASSWRSLHALFSFANRPSGQKAFEVQQCEGFWNTQSLGEL